MHKIHVANGTGQTIYVLAAPKMEYVLSDMFSETLIKQLHPFFKGLNPKATSAFIYEIVGNAYLAYNVEYLDAVRAIMTSAATIKIEPGQVTEVHKYLNGDPLNYFKASAWASLFDSATKSLLVVTADMKQAALVETHTDKSWIATAQGLRRAQYGTLWQEGGDLHYWNARTKTTQLRSYRSPALLMFNDKLHCFFRDGHNSNNDGLMCSTFNGDHFSDPGHLAGARMSEGVGVAVQDGDLHLFCRDHSGRQMYLLKGKAVDKLSFRWLGVDVKKRPSAAVLNGRVCALACDGTGNSIMLSTGVGDAFQTGNTREKSSAAPAIVSFNNRFHLYYKDLTGRAIFHSVSDDGIRWNHMGRIYLDTSAGVAVAEYQGKLFMFYRDGTGNGILVAISADGHSFHTPADPHFGLKLDGDVTCALLGDRFLVMGLEPGSNKICYSIFDPTLLKFSSSTHILERSEA